MGEYVWTDMSIGGKIPRDKVDELLELSFDENQSDSIEEWAKAQQPFYMGGIVNYGNPEELTAFCREHRLPYLFSWAAQGGCFGSGLEYWFPDMDEPQQVDADDNGRPTIAVQDLREYLKHDRTLKEVIDIYARANTSALPPIEIDEDPALKFTRVGNENGFVDIVE